MLPDLVSISLFLKAVKLKSLSRAAEQSHISLSAASRRLSLLEHHFKVSLLKRTPSGVTATAAGEALAAHAQGLFRMIDVMHADLADYAQGAIGRVRLCANSSAMSQDLPAQLTEWTQRYPKIKIDLREERSREILQAIREGEADVGIVTTVASGDQLELAPYCCDRLCLVVPENHPFNMSHARFDELLGYDFVGLEDSAAITTLVAEAAAAAGVPLRLRLQVRSFEAMCRLITAGQGVGVLPIGAVRFFRHAMNLRFIEIEDDWADRKMFVCMRKDDITPSSLALFEYLRSCAGPET